jgi:hypothetical protein
MLIFCVAVSIFGIVLITIWANSPPVSNENLSWRKPVVGFLFSFICILGSLASLFPRTCSEAFHFSGEPMSADTRRTLSVSHHPNCEGFSAHVVGIKGRLRCAACTGLLLGAIMALVGAIVYFSGWLQIENGYILSFVGAVGVIVGFLQFKFIGYVRLISNSIFVLGAFLCLIGVDQVSQSVANDVFTLMLMVFWILTRIELSQWDHSRTCDNCETRCGFGRKMGDESED